VAQVVGVAANVRHNLKQEPVPTVYLPHARDPWGNIVLVIRAAAAPGHVLGPLRSAVGEVDAALPTAALQPLPHHTRQATQRERAFSRLMAAFAALALVLAAVGTYGALANLVVRRLPELGVRAALGARPRDLHRLVLRRAWWMIVAGGATGVVLALAIGRLMEDLLFGVAATDPVTVLAAAAVLAGVGLMASFPPMVRAGRVDPIRLLASG
jgi:putative ABC transport system permease protein